jgi:2-iminobutanoate/2-iminopropanoate deaminase
MRWKGEIPLMKRFLAMVCALLGVLPVVRAQSVEFKNPPELSKPNGYSQVAIVNRGRLVFVAGQVGMDKDGKMANDFTAQAKQAFANLKVALVAAGAKPADLIKINYLVVGLNHEKLVALREARDSVIDKEHPPASTLAGVQALFRDDVQIEIEAEAVIP